MRSVGPSSAKIAVVGEAPGAEEEKLGIPFVGASGQELTRLLAEAGITRQECFLTNVFFERPPNNDLTAWYRARRELPAGYSFPPIEKGKYITPDYLHSVQRLRQDLLQLRPNCVVALGNTASWALLGQTGISKLRGVVQATSDGLKVLPTYHPAAVLRQWDLRAVVIADLMKAKKESESPELTRPEREIWIEPTTADLWTFYHQHLLSASRISVDVETHGGQITSIAFGPSPWHSLVIPLWDRRKPDFSYWSADDELFVWQFIQMVLQLPAPKIFQNGLYDVQYLWRAHGLVVVNFSEDTMLCHHVLQPEMPKSLGFLGSIYTSEIAWKNLRHVASNKRDE